MSVFDEENEISFYDGVPDNIRAKYDEWDSLVKRLTQKSEVKGLPRDATFEITPLCNLSCKMCFIRLDKEKMDGIGKLMTTVQWTKIAKETAELGVLSILITGGEPFLHPEFIDIYTNIAKLGFLITLYTNAVMLNDKIIETLKKYPPNFLYITIYGSSEETYEKLCGNGEAYNSVVNNIKIFKDIFKDIPINLRTTIVKENIKDLDEIREFAKQMQLKFTFGFGKIKPIRGAEYRDIEKSRLSPEEVVKMQESALNSKKFEKNLTDVNIQKTNVTDDMKNLNCSAAKTTYTISWDGKMLPCQIFSSPYKLPLDIGIKNAWNELKNIRSTIKKPDRCINCKYKYYCGNCPAKIQAESGTYIDGESYKCMQQSCK